MALNKQDGGGRRYILCQLDEPTAKDSEARKAGFESIDQIARERIKRAASSLGDIRGEEGGTPDRETKNLGFKHYYVKEPQARTIDKITEFDPEKSALIADDMVAEFACPAADTAGEDTLLATWAAADGYKFTDKTETPDIAGYKAHYAGNSKLYLIAQGWGAAQTKELLNRIGTYKMNVNMVIVYPYSFTFESLKELELGLKQSLNKENIRLERRY